MLSPNLRQRLPQVLEWDHDDGIFLPMINDTARNQFWSDTIKDVVAGKVVGDIGAGTGFLSILAIQHGAKLVYAIEQDYWRYNLICHVVQEMGLEDKIIPIHNKVQNESLQLPDCDVFISEMIGSKIFEGGQWYINEFAEKHNKPLYPALIDLTMSIHEDFGPLEHKEKIRGFAEKKFEPGIDIDPQFVKVINDLMAEKYDAERINDEQEMLLASRVPESVATMQIDTIDFNTPYRDLEYVQNFDLGEINRCMVSITWRMRHKQYEVYDYETTWSIPVKRFYKVDFNKQSISAKYNRKAENWYISVIEKV